MKKIAVVFDSHDGHTQHISEKLCEEINKKNLSTQLIHISELSPQQLHDFEVLVFGSPIRYGKHLPDIVSFLQDNKATLDNLRTAFFSVNLTARKPHRNTAETSNYTKKLFAQLDWQPDIAEVFAGKLNYPVYRFHDRLMIRFIMWITKGPTEISTVHDYTNWEQVAQFAEKIAKHSQ